MIFREQIVLYSEAGVLPAEALEQVLAQVKELDMDKVRADIDAEQKKEVDEPA
ncbi:Thioredoxin [hydrothermal vent metagenome]|uniref:Thioredoxin n=1 Tax=hydrothermal vent metagenome TaxID=652676 RepID=A0A3B0X5S8_9ZZZZ